MVGTDNSWLSAPRSIHRVPRHGAGAVGTFAFGTVERGRSLESNPPGGSSFAPASLRATIKGQSPLGAAAPSFTARGRLLL
jgi:hypothetical protein